MIVEVEKKESQGRTSITLSGVIDERTSFESVIGSTQSSLDIHCKGITRINSIGVKNWVRFFSNLRKKGVRLRFLECSSVVVQQLEFFHNVVEPQEIESVFIPLVCDFCGKNDEKLSSIQDLRTLGFRTPAWKCTCGGSLVLDDADEFFQAIKS